MGQDTKIEWAHHTFNPWIGCSKVSEGCKNCYAETIDKRWGRNNWGKDATRTRTSAQTWQNPLNWNRKAARAGIRYRVFCASLADVFEAREDLVDIREELFLLMEFTPHLDWLVLTKRPEHIMNMVPRKWLDNWPAHVWIGTTVENQEQADKRIPILLQVPAAVRFLSCEPLLSELMIVHHLKDLSAKQVAGKPAHELRGIQWVICGGESGHNARPMNPEWASLLQQQCFVCRVPFLFKQWGEYAPLYATVNEWAEYRDDGKYLTQHNGVVPVKRFRNGDSPEGLLVLAYRVGKKNANRLLNRVEYNEFPKGGEKCLA